MQLSGGRVEVVRVVVCWSWWTNTIRIVYGSCGHNCWIAMRVHKSDVDPSKNSLELKLLRFLITDAAVQAIILSAVQFICVCVCCLMGTECIRCSLTPNFVIPGLLYLGGYSVGAVRSVCCVQLLFITHQFHV